MMKEIINLWLKHKTKNLTEIPLFLVSFDQQKYMKNGEKDSCMIHIHPEMEKDEYLIGKIKELVTYVRKKYDMDIFTRI